MMLFRAAVYAIGYANPIDLNYRSYTPDQRVTVELNARHECCTWLELRKGVRMLLRNKAVFDGLRGGLSAEDMSLRIRTLSTKIRPRVPDRADYVDEQQVSRKWHNKLPDHEELQDLYGDWFNEFVRAALLTGLLRSSQYAGEVVEYGAELVAFWRFDAAIDQTKDQYSKSGRKRKSEDDFEDKEAEDKVKKLRLEGFENGDEKCPPYEDLTR